MAGSETSNGSASLLTGVLWQALGASVALGAGALLAALSAVGLLTLVQEPPRLGSEATA